MIKVLLIALLSWPRYLVYGPTLKWTQRIWDNHYQKPPRFWKGTKWLLFLQSLVKWISVLLGIIPLGPISMLTTYLLIRAKHLDTIRAQLNGQSERVENYREFLRNREKELEDAMSPKRIEFDERAAQVASELALTKEEAEDIVNFYAELERMKEEKKKADEEAKKKEEDESELLAGLDITEENETTWTEEEYGLDKLKEAGEDN